MSYHFSLSKNISGTYNAASLAADDLRERYPERKIYLIDSLNASLTQGILAIYAIEMRESGRAFDEIADAYEYCTGSHVGPDTIALFFLAKYRELCGK